MADRKYLDHAVQFLNEWDALYWNKDGTFKRDEPTGDDCARVMYQRWLILPMKRLSKCLELRLGRESYFTSKTKSQQLQAFLSSELIDDECANFGVPLSDFIATAFEDDLTGDADKLAADIRKAVEAGIKKGLGIHRSNK